MNKIPLLLFRHAFCVVFMLFWGGQIAFAGPHIVIDLKNGEVLSAKQATEPWHPASITKLMTLYVAAKAVRQGRLSLKSLVPISANANSVSPSKMGFKTGTQVTLDNALKMLIVKSANDIAVAIGERVAGSEAAFVAEMNRTAQALGMTGTNFVNPHGLPAKEHIVTARDMALLGLAIHRDFPELKPLFNISAIRSGKRILRSHNLLLENYRGTTGMKTGFTCASGLTLVASAKRGDKEFLVVILGEHSSIDRAEKAALLLEYAFTGKLNKRYGTLVDYTPLPKHAKPADLRHLVCNQPSKIRKFQIVVPQPKPKKGLFKKAKYVSPQRKFFSEGLGDPSHPQGALVTTPSHRQFRSHILQPRIKREPVTVYTGPYKGARPTDLVIHRDDGVAESEPLIANLEGNSSVKGTLPVPRLSPLKEVLVAITQPKDEENPAIASRIGAVEPAATSAASAFLSQPSSVPTNTPSLHQQSVVRASSFFDFTKKVRKPETTEEPVGEPLDLGARKKRVGNLFLPRSNPLR